MANTLYVGNDRVKKVDFNSVKCKKVYLDNVKVFSSGNIVTYYVNTNEVHQEEVEADASCLSPKTFTPSISGWTFIGWRTDTAANMNVLSSKIMGDDPVTLYAVFRRTLTATFNGNGATSGSVASISSYQYYNFGNYNNPTFALPANGFARTDYRFTGWNYGAVGTKVTMTSNITVYAQWTATVVRMIQNGQLASGVSLIVWLQNCSSLPAPEWSGLSVKMYAEATNEDTSFGSDSYFYFNKDIPSGKTVHIKMRIYNSQYGDTHIYETEARVIGFPKPVPVQSEYITYNTVTVGFMHGGGTSDTTMEENVSKTKTFTMPNNCFLGLRLGIGDYGRGRRACTFVIEDIWYDI